MQSLVRPLFDGKIDIVGDAHGEIDVLRALLRHLGYRNDGLRHLDGRRLVFLGDLTDRGPDSPAVVALVQRLVELGVAQCVLGNHDLNILLDHRKHENKWFFGEKFLDSEGTVVPQVLADDATRQRVLAFFRTLPLALERNDVRVVHACWDDKMIGIASKAKDVVALYQHHADFINHQLATKGGLDDIAKGLMHQNRNPVKLLTSGPEERTDKPQFSGGRLRNERRVFWWNGYRDEAFCLFGHYSILRGRPRGNHSAFCVDFGVGKRWTERRLNPDGPFTWMLAAARLPEKLVVFDDGEKQPCVA